MVEQLSSLRKQLNAELEKNSANRAMLLSNASRNMHSTGLLGATGAVTRSSSSSDGNSTLRLRQLELQRRLQESSTLGRSNRLFLHHPTVTGANTSRFNQTTVGDVASPPFDETATVSTLSKEAVVRGNRYNDVHDSRRGASLTDNYAPNKGAFNEMGAGLHINDIATLEELAERPM
jgi:hypothetical protein